MPTTVDGLVCRAASVSSLPSTAGPVGKSPRLGDQVTRTVEQQSRRCDDLRHHRPGHARRGLTGLRRRTSTGRWGGAGRVGRAEQLPGIGDVQDARDDAALVDDAEAAAVGEGELTAPPGQKAAHPPGSSRDPFDTPVSMSSTSVSTRQQRFTRVRLPGPYLIPHGRLFLVAHHDGLQPTQQEVVWSLPPTGDSEGAPFAA
jgi:hypothetical protein